MPSTERTAYERGLAQWLPRILFGADAVRAEAGKTKAVGLSDLPGRAV